MSRLPLPQHASLSHIRPPRPLGAGLLRESGPTLLSGTQCPAEKWDGASALQQLWAQLMGWAHGAIGGGRCQPAFGGWEGPPQVSGRGVVRQQGCLCPGVPPWTPGGVYTAGDSADPRWAPGRSVRARSPAPRPPSRPRVAPPSGARRAIPGPSTRPGHPWSLLHGGRAEGDLTCGAHSLPRVQSRPGSGQQQWGAGGLSHRPPPRAGPGRLSSRESAVPQAEEEKRKKKEEAARKRQEQEVASACEGLPAGRHFNPHSAVRVSRSLAAPHLCPPRPRGAPGRRRLQAGACHPDPAVCPAPVCPTENLHFPPLTPPAWVSPRSFCRSLNLGAGVGPPSGLGAVTPRVCSRQRSWPR